MPTQAYTINGIYTNHITNKITGAVVNQSQVRLRVEGERTWMAGRVKPTTKWIPPTAGTWGQEVKTAATGNWVWEDSTNRHVRKGTFDAFTGFSWGYPVPITHSSLKMRTQAAIEAQAVRECLNRIQQGKVNLAQAFAERRQTANLVSGTMRRIAAGYTALRKGDVAGALRALGSPSNRNRLSSRDIADQWLEIQYGWKPLLSDVYASVDKLRKKDEDINRYILTAKREVTEKSFASTFLAGGDCDRTVTASYSRGCFVRLDYRVKHSIVASMSSMGVLDPMTLAWELLPWSFVVDWFLPIGSYLGAVSATQGLAFLGGSKTLRDVTTGTAIWRPGSLSTRTKSLYATATGEIKNVTRSTYASSPTPKFPSMKDPFSTIHVANALALLRGSFRR